MRLPCRPRYVRTNLGVWICRVTGSSPVRGAKKKRSHRVRSFLFVINRKRTCDIMIKISFAYWLSVAKLVVDGRKNSLNGYFSPSKAQSKNFWSKIFLRAKILCDCRVALAMFAQTWESEFVVSQVRPLSGEPRKTLENTTFLRLFAFLKHFKFRSKNPFESQKMRFRMIFCRMIVNRKIKQKFCRIRDGNTEQKINIEREKPDCFQLSIKYRKHKTFPPP